MVTERQIREDHNVSAIFLIYSIFSNRNQISLFSRRACDKVITMTGKKRWGARARWWAIVIFQLAELNMYGLLTKCEVKMTGYWPSSFFVCLGTETKSRSINWQKKERGQYPAILTEQTWSIKDLWYGFRGNFACGIQRVVPRGRDGSILPARVVNHSARFRSSCPFTELPI